jgi:GTP-binding protein Era
VQIEELDITPRLVTLGAVIVCEKNSHKGIVIGKGGGLLKRVGTAARLECEEYFEAKVNLKLWVKIAEDWRNREKFINEYGLKSE